MGNNWADEHPVQMKAVEIGLGAAFSLASTVLVTWITAKINDHFKEKEREKEFEAASEAEAIDTVVEICADVFTEMGAEYGADWRNNEEARNKANAMLESRKALIFPRPIMKTQ